MPANLHVRATPTASGYRLETRKVKDKVNGVTVTDEQEILKQVGLRDTYDERS